MLLSPNQSILFHSSQLNRLFNKEAVVRNITPFRFITALSKNESTPKSQKYNFQRFISINPKGKSLKISHPLGWACPTEQAGVNADLLKITFRRDVKKLMFHLIFDCVIVF